MDQAKLTNMISNLKQNGGAHGIPYADVLEAFELAKEHAPEPEKPKEATEDEASPEPAEGRFTRRGRH